MEAHGIEVRETVPASRKLGPGEARSLVRAARRLIVIKGSKIDEWKPAGQAPAAAIAAMLGPTGNLRAPTLRVGPDVVVGFNEGVYADLLLGRP